MKHVGTFIIDHSDHWHILKTEFLTLVPTKEQPLPITDSELCLTRECRQKEKFKSLAKYVQQSFISLHTFESSGTNKKNCKQYKEEYSLYSLFLWDATNIPVNADYGHIWNKFLQWYYFNTCKCIVFYWTKWHF